MASKRKRKNQKRKQRKRKHFLRKSKDYFHDVMVEEMFHGAATAKEALVISPDKVIVTTPGADNKKVL